MSELPEMCVSGVNVMNQRQALPNARPLQLRGLGLGIETVLRGATCA